jgi:hypothetical protein
MAIGNIKQNISLILQTKKTNIMKKINSFLLLISLLFSFVSCKNGNGKNKTYVEIEKVSWLIGNWENITEEGKLSETWEKKNDSTLVGESYFIRDKDTLHSERIELSQKEEELFYIPIVKGQNNNKPVTFKLTLATENEFTFENPTHDYPQKIVYKMVNASNILATISGKQQGKVTTEIYPMTKK